MGKMQYHSYLLYDPRRIDLQNLAIFEKRGNRDAVLMRHKNAAVINAVLMMAVKFMCTTIAAMM